MHDSNLVAGFSAQDIPERYFAIPAANPGYMARSGYILEFAAAGNTGGLLDYFSGQGKSLSAPFSWQIANGRLRVDFAQAIVVNYVEVADSPALAGVLTPAEQAAFAGEQLNVVQRTYGYTFTRLNDGVLADPVLREADMSLQVLPTATSKGQFGGTQEVDRTAESTDSLRSSLDIQPIPFAGSCPSGGQSVCVPGTWSSFAVYSPGNDLGFITGTAGAALPVTAWGDVQTFTGVGANSGTVTGAISGVSATWAVSADGTLTVTYPSGWVQRMQVIENQGLEYGVFHEFTRGAERFATYNINVKADAGFSFTVPYLANAAGEIWQGEVNNWVVGNLNQDGSRPIGSYFGWRFTAVDDSALNLNGLFENETCDPDGLANDLYASLSLGKRTVTADGRVVIDRTGNGARLRSWYPIASTTVGGDRQFYAMESERRNGLVFIAPRLNLLREIPVPQWKCSNLSP